MSQRVLAASAVTSLPVRVAPLYWLALGTFAVGTEGFMIAAILPKIASDLAVGIEAAGLLVTVFALAYAVSSPILTTLAGNVDRRKLLIGSMVAFAAANVVASFASSYAALVFARVLLAFAAGLYVPNANALASVLVPPERRGRALAIVNGGLTVAVALGVPLGALIGTNLGWRTTFGGVAVLALIAVVGLSLGLPVGIGGGKKATTLRERVAVARHPGVFPALLVTTLWAMGGYTVYTFIAPYLVATTGIQGSQIGVVLFIWGAAAGVGIFAGGSASDRYSPRRVIATALPAMMAALASLSLIAHTLAPAIATPPVLIAVAIWGVAAWSFFPAQQARLVGMTGESVASVVLSLNASFLYLGFSLGSALGALVLKSLAVTELGWVGALAIAGALALYAASSRRRAAAVDAAKP